MEPSPLRRVAALAIAVGVSELAGVIGSLFTAAAMPTWYAALAKPALTPPGWVFPIAWSLLYLLMGVAAYLVWRTGPGHWKIRAALLAFSAQLALNAAWSVIFFGMHQLAAAVVEIAALWLAIIWTMVAFARHSRPAAWLLVPYLAWVTFAAYLTWSIWRLN